MEYQPYCIHWVFFLQNFLLYLGSNNIMLIITNKYNTTEKEHFIPSILFNCSNKNKALGNKHGPPINPINKILTNLNTWGNM